MPILSVFFEYGTYNNQNASDKRTDANPLFVAWGILEALNIKTEVDIQVASMTFDRAICRSLSLSLSECFSFGFTVFTRHYVRCQQHKRKIHWLVRMLMGVSTQVACLKHSIYRMIFTECVVDESIHVHDEWIWPIQV